MKMKMKMKMKIFITILGLWTLLFNVNIQIAYSSQDNCFDSKDCKGQPVLSTTVSSRIFVVNSSNDSKKLEDKLTLFGNDPDKCRELQQKKEKENIPGNKKLSERENNYLNNCKSMNNFLFNTLLSTGEFLVTPVGNYVDGYFQVKLKQPESGHSLNEMRQEMKDFKFKTCVECLKSFGSFVYGIPRATMHSIEWWTRGNLGFGNSFYQLALDLKNTKITEDSDKFSIKSKISCRPRKISSKSGKMKNKGCEQEFVFGPITLNSEVIFIKESSSMLSLDQKNTSIELRTNVVINIAEIKVNFKLSKKDDLLSTITNKNAPKITIAPEAISIHINESDKYNKSLLDQAVLLLGDGNQGLKNVIIDRVVDLVNNYALAKVMSKIEDKVSSLSGSSSTNTFSIGSIMSKTFDNLVKEHSDKIPILFPEHKDSFQYIEDFEQLLIVNDLKGMNVDSKDIEGKKNRKTLIKNVLGNHEQLKDIVKLITDNSIQPKILREHLYRRLKEIFNKIFYNRKDVENCMDPRQCLLTFFNPNEDPESLRNVSSKEMKKNRTQRKLSRLINPNDSSKHLVLDMKDSYIEGFMLLKKAIEEKENMNEEDMNIDIKALIGLNEIFQKIRDKTSFPKYCSSVRSMFTMHDLGPCTVAKIEIDIEELNRILKKFVEEAGLTNNSLSKGLINLGKFNPEIKWDKSIKKYIIGVTENFNISSTIEDSSSKKFLNFNWRLKDAKKDKLLKNEDVTIKKIIDGVSRQLISGFANLFFDSLGTVGKIIDVDILKDIVKNGFRYKLPYEMELQSNEENGNIEVEIKIPDCK
ncbi:MAG: hypothetical protein HQK49_03725 [Oligoflexia bacterium]|nr:hypothetical protein [Oligoflexia bacterium]